MSFKTFLTSKALFFAFFALLATIVVIAPESALAQRQDLFNDTASADANTLIFVDLMCNIVNALASDVARAVAAFAVIFLGFSLFLGKISWGVALAVFIGLGAIFSAPTIVDVISQGDEERSGDLCSVQANNSYSNSGSDDVVIEEEVPGQG